MFGLFGKNDEAEKIRKRLRDSGGTAAWNSSTMNAKLTKPQEPEQPIPSESYSLLTPQDNAPEFPRIPYMSLFVSESHLQHIEASINFFRNQISIPRYRPDHNKHLIFWCENNCTNLFCILTESRDWITIGFYAEEDLALLRLAL